MVVPVKSTVSRDLNKFNSWPENALFPHCPSLSPKISSPKLSIFHCFDTSIELLLSLLHAVARTDTIMNNLNSLVFIMLVLQFNSSSDPTSTARLSNFTLQNQPHRCYCIADEI